MLNGPIAEELLRQEIRKGVVPERLYRFRPINEWLRTVIFDSTMWHSSPLAFNDPFDGQLTFTHRLGIRPMARQFRDIVMDGRSPNRRQRRQRAMELQKDPSLQQRLFENALRDTVSGVGICCYSKKWDSILQWAYYADAHRGVVLGFDLQEDPQYFVSPVEVQYVTEYPVLDYNATPVSCMIALIKHKAAIWSHEDEWRVYKGSEGIYSFKPRALAQITFGVNADRKAIDQVRSWCANAGRTHIQFYKAERMDRRFGITRLPLK